MKEKLITELKAQGRGNRSISRESYDYIKRSFQYIANGSNAARDASRVWLKVHCEKHDPKFGAFMICMATEEWRDTTMDEFYGSVVD